MNSLYPVFLYITFSQNWRCFSEDKYTKFENMTTTLITNGDKQHILISKTHLIYGIVSGKQTLQVYIYSFKIHI